MCGPPRRQQDTASQRLPSCRWQRQAAAAAALTPSRGPTAAKNRRRGTAARPPSASRPAGRPPLALPHRGRALHQAGAPLLARRQQLQAAPPCSRARQPTGPPPHARRLWQQRQLQRAPPPLLRPPVVRPCQLRCRLTSSRPTPPRRGSTALRPRWRPACLASTSWSLAWQRRLQPGTRPRGGRWRQPNRCQVRLNRCS